MPRGSTRSGGWIRSLSATPTLGIFTEDPAMRVPYNFGLGVNDSGRMSTISRNGSAITFPDAYGFNEAWELRWTFADTGNSAKNGIFVNVRTSAANSSGIRGMEMGAEQEGNIAVGGLEGANFFGGTRGGSGDVGYIYGVTGETKHNASYAGTVTSAAAVRGKFLFDSAATYTYASIFRADLEPAAGGGAIDAILGVGTVTAGCTVNYLIDTSALESTNYSANRVVLWKFKDSGGTDRFLVYDADAATSVLVDTNETE